MLIPRTFSLICICMCMCIRRSTHARTHTRTHTRIHTHAHTPIASYSTHTRMLSPLPCFYLPLFPPSSPPFFLPLPLSLPPFGSLTSALALGTLISPAPPPPRTHQAPLLSGHPDLGAHQPPPNTHSHAHTHTYTRTHMHDHRRR